MNLVLRSFGFVTAAELAGLPAGKGQNWDQGCDFIEDGNGTVMRDR